jgi:hypothetical protein
MRGFFYIQTEIKAAISTEQDEKFIPSLPRGILVGQQKASQK